MESAAGFLAALCASRATIVLLPKQVHLQKDVGAVNCQSVGLRGQHWHRGTLAGGEGYREAREEGQKQKQGVSRSPHGA